MFIIDSYNHYHCFQQFLSLLSTIFIIDYKIFIIVSHNLYHRLQDIYHCFLKSLSLLNKSFSLISRSSLSLFPTIFIFVSCNLYHGSQDLYHCFLQSLSLLPTIFIIFKRLLRSKIFINVYKKTRRSHLQYFVNFSLNTLIEPVLKHLFSRFL